MEKNKTHNFTRKLSLLWLCFCFALLTSCSNTAVKGLEGRERAAPQYVGFEPTKDYGKEIFADNEDKVIADIVQLLSDHLIEQYSKKNLLRDTHPKSNGCVKAEFIINDNLPEKYRLGIFKEPKTYPAWIRFSNSEPEVTADGGKDFRGLGIKLFGVEGSRLPVPGDEQHTQDFLFIAFPAFFAGNPEDFLEFFTLAFGNPDKPKFARGKYFGARSRALKNVLVGRKQFANPLEITWFSVAPFLLGPPASEGGGYAVKYKLDSAYPGTSHIPENPTYDYLRAAMETTLSQQDWYLDFKIQLQTSSDPKVQPIEDTLAIWDEQQSPYFTVASIRIPKQQIGSPAQLKFCEDLSFNPWHGLTAHRPIGGLNRARRDVMKAMSDLRLKANDIERIEPTGYETFGK